jgi:hypothetical protein
MKIAFSKIGIYRVFHFGKMFLWQGLASPFLTKLRSLNEKLVNLRLGIGFTSLALPLSSILQIQIRIAFGATILFFNLLADASA